VNWLDHSKTLREQSVDVNETLLLRRKYFFSDQNVDARDPVQLNLLYVQVSVIFVQILPSCHKPTYDCLIALFYVVSVQDRLINVLFGFQHRFSGTGLSNVPDCGVRGPRFKSLRRQLQVFLKSHYDIQPWAWLRIAPCGFRGPCVLSL